MSRVPTSIPIPERDACALPISASPAAQSHARLRVPDTASSASTPGFRCRKFRPQVELRLGAAVTSCDRDRPLFSRPATTDGDERPGRVFSTAHEPDEHVADVLCRTTARLAGANRTVAPRTHSSRGAPTPRGCEPRTPFLDESPNTSGLSTVGSEPPLLPRFRRRSAASNTRSRTRCMR